MKIIPHSIRALGCTLILASGTAWIGGAVAAPAPTEPPRQETFRVSDLDLSTPTGVATLYQRIRAAAVRVCKPWNGDSAGTKVTWDLCRDSTLAHAVGELKLPALTAYYEARLPRNSKPPAVASTARR
jgi:UrcA family protein